MPFAVMAYYLWAVGSDLPGLRLAVGFAGVQSFPHGSRFNPQTLDFKGFPDLR